MPVQKIGDVFASSNDLKALARQAQRLRDLEHVLFEAVPSALASASRVANLKSRTLLVLADNAAIAAKFRQLAPRLLQHLNERGIEVTVLRVEVQVKPHKIKDEDDVTNRVLPPDAIKDFERLSERLPASPLKTALSRLIARRKRGSRS